MAGETSAGVKGSAETITAISEAIVDFGVMITGIFVAGTEDSAALIEAVTFKGAEIFVAAIADSAVTQGSMAGIEAGGGTAISTVTVGSAVMAGSMVAATMVEATDTEGGKS